MIQNDEKVEGRIIIGADVAKASIVLKQLRDGRPVCAGVQTIPNKAADIHLSGRREDGVSRGPELERLHPRQCGVWRSSGAGSGRSERKSHPIQRPGSCRFTQRGSLRANPALVELGEWRAGRLMRPAEKPLGGVVLDLGQRGNL